MGSLPLFKGPAELAERAELEHASADTAPPGLSAVSSCGTCGAPVRWGIFHTGRKAIVDAHPVPLGNLVIRAGRVHVVPPGPGRYQVHQVTCRNPPARGPRLRLRKGGRR